MIVKTLLTPGSSASVGACTDLTGSQFERVVLTGARFERVDLTGLEFHPVDLAV